MSDTASIQLWASLRLASGSALFITYFVYFCAYWFSEFKKEERKLFYVHMSDLGSKMFLFGVGVLLSLNYFQACIFTTIFTYFNMVAILVMIGVNFLGVAESIRSKVCLALYFLMFMWYVGIMSDLYITFKNDWNQLNSIMLIKNDCLFLFLSIFSLLILEATYF